MTSISVMAPINTTGLGYHMLQLSYVLRDLNISSLLPIGRADPEMLKRVRTTLGFPVYNQRPDPKEDILFLFWHPCSRVPLEVKHQVLCTVWETGLTNKELEDLATFDGVIVPSHWHRDYLLSKGFDKPIMVLPLPQNETGYQKRTLSLNSTAQFYFSNVGKFESRKGSETLVQTCALLDQMDHPPVDRGELTLFHGTLIWNNPFVPDWEKQAEALFLKYDFREIPCQLYNDGVVSLEYRARRFVSARGKVELTLFPDRFPNRDAVLSLANVGSHVGFYPTKAEGWGMPIWEGWLSGVPIVCPNYRGISEYFHKDMFIEIPIVGEEVAHDGVFFHGDRGTWGIVDPQDCANILAQLYVSKLASYGVLLGCAADSLSAMTSNIRSSDKAPNCGSGVLETFFATITGEL